MFHQKFRALKAVRQRLAHRLLNYPRTGKADHCTGLGNDHVSHESKAGGHAAHGRIGQHRNEWQFFCTQLGQCGTGFCHLH